MARLTVYLPLEEKKDVRKRANALGISVSEYARRATVSRARLNLKRVEAGLAPGREKW